MAAAPPTESAPTREATPRAQLVVELERRIEMLEAAKESEVGSFTTWDWIACVVGGVLVPALALWWFAP